MSTAKWDKVLLLGEINSRAGGKKLKFLTAFRVEEQSGLWKTSKGFLNITAIYLISNLSLAAAAADPTGCEVSQHKFSEAEKRKTNKTGKFLQKFSIEKKASRKLQIHLCRGFVKRADGNLFFESAIVNYWLCFQQYSAIYIPSWSSSRTEEKCLHFNFNARILELWKNIFTN